ncbi:hypothetical protein SSX86_021883 [Deinandra increscens subsp. villosa]|uniref:Vesicle transport protein GOT1B n=1 Tax=Deinandra increscens subsp. villosa TaxID=3103831 RepID=A0AAP0GT13_9ASTR
MVGFEMDDWKKIGLGLTGFGVFFSFLGMIFFFDKGLLAIGNILFISGVIMTIGVKSSLQFFLRRSNYKGTISFGIGFFFVIIGWPVIGMAAEAYGFIILFRFLDAFMKRLRLYCYRINIWLLTMYIFCSGFWPTLSVFVQKIPVIGWVFQQPFIRSFLDRYRGKRAPV